MNTQPKPLAYQFWMVWRAASPTTNYRHDNKQSALNEAQRLSSENPGEIFYVLKSTAAVFSDAPTPKRLPLQVDEIPF